MVTDTLGVGGAEKQISQMAEGLRHIGHETAVLVFDSRGPWKDHLQSRGIPVVESQALFTRRRHIPLLPWRFFRFVKTVVSLKPDLMITMKYRDSIWGSLAGWFARVPIRIAYRVGIDYEPQGVYDLLLKLVGPFSRARTTWFVGNSHAVINALRTVEGVKDRLSVIHQSVDIPENGKEKARSFRLQYGIDDQSICIGLLANLYPVKNHLMLVRAARSVIDSYPKAVFLLAGESRLDTYKSQIEAEIIALHLDKQVRLLGALPDPAGFLATIDIGVLCSFSEGFSNSVLEYMAYGKPTIATRVGGNPDAIEDGVTGYLIPSGDEAALAEKLRLLIANPDLRRLIGQKARDHVEIEFSREKEMRQWHKLLTRLYQEKNT